jgi:hypothetical protein
MFDVSLPWANFWYDAFNVLLFVGAFAVAVGTYGSIKMSAVKEKFADERIIANEAETKRAIADSDGAKEGAARANERIAELSTQAEQLRKDTADANARALEAQLALEKFKQPRLLSEKQTDTILGKLKQFAGTRFDAAVLPGDPEAIVFLSYITATLEKAGWVWVEWNPPNGPLAMTYSFPGKPNIGQVGFFGVSLQINPAHASTLSAPADALGVALIAEGFESTLDVIDNASIPNKDTVHLIVGKKRQ